MGFSVSGSVVVVLLGLFIALGTFYTTAANDMEDLAAAEGDQAERFDTVQATELAVDSVSLSGTSDDCDVTLSVNNTGSTVLALNDTTLMVGNDVQTGWRDGATVNGDPDTWLWGPGERLTVTRTGFSSKPQGAGVVTKTGVTARAETEGLTC